MPAKIFSVSIIGLSCELIEVEADISRGLSSFKVVGLGDTSVQESKERVRSAIKNSGLTFPIQKKTINLAPAELKKQGSTFDMPIATAILAASNQIPYQIFKDTVVIGELSLNGDIKPIKGILPITEFAKKKGFKMLFLPKQNEAEAGLIDGIRIYGISSLKEFVAFCQGRIPLDPAAQTDIPNLGEEQSGQSEQSDISFSSIYGLENAKRALVISAAGGHNILLRGQPGTGKTILARAYAGILPRLTREEAFEVTALYSITEGLPPDKTLITERPFREVHHTASKISIIGGGATLRPGEITLAHKGILFMDEITEFPRNVLETLRQPLEDGFITLNRAKSRMRFPCEFTLLAAMNNCPCGRLGNDTNGTNGTKKHCTCTPQKITAYQSRLSGPILDRFDIFIETPKISIKNFLSTETKDDETLKQKIALARALQRERYSKIKPNENARLSAENIRTHCALAPKAKATLDKAASSLGLSNRGYLKIIKTAQTIMDIDQKSQITEDAILEAIQYRAKLPGQ